MKDKKENPNGKPVFSSAAMFRRKLESYLGYCEEMKRIPNVAGFCCFCEISRSDYFALRKFYPLRFDVTESAFIDRAVNIKVSNTGTSLAYLLSGIDGISLDCADDSDDSEIICEHDGFGDGR